MTKSVVESIVAAQIAIARAEARSALAAASEDAAAARGRRDTARATVTSLRTQLSGVRERAVTQAHAATADRGADMIRRLGAMTRTLPAAARAEWPQWTVDAAPHRTRAPEWLRIGLLAAAPEVPALLPLLDHGHLAITGTDPRAENALIAGLLLRAIGAAAPGALRVTIYDPDHLGAALAGFAPLRTAGLARFVGPGALAALLDETAAEIRRINERVLAGSAATLRELAFATGRRTEPWRVVVLLGDGDGGPDATGVRTQLDRIVRTGAACGVHLIARGRTLGLTGAGRVETVHVTADRAVASSCGAIRLDTAPPADLVTATSRLIADLTSAGPAKGTLADLLPEKFWTSSAAFGLSAPIGVVAATGEMTDLVLADHPPHALIGGPSGSGKTNLIYAWLASLTTRYSPDELALYLLDFKEGVSFARFAPGAREASWLPHVRLVGVNINSDREFGLALLRFLSDELRRRAAAARAHDVTKLSELRVEDPGGRWPRIVAVIDEFQVLLAGRDAITAEAVTLLEDLARRGRSQGIHLVLASQDVAGIEALWGRGALVAQFSLRVALPKARRILADMNIAADDVPRFHAVVNADAGATEGNRIVRLCDAGDRDGWNVLQRQMWQMRSPLASPPTLFDGESVPSLPASVPLSTGPYAMVGARIAVEAGPASLSFGRSPGRNLAILGARRDDAIAVLGSVAWSLRRSAGADPWSDGAVQVVSFDPESADAHPSPAEVLDALAAPSDHPRFLLGYALDAAPPPFRAALRDLLHTGPERGIHVIGWWRSVSRLRDDLGGPTARTDAIGAFVALDVHGPELAPFCPVPGGPAWYPRRHRALFFDRSMHRVPEIVIPYGLPR